MDMTKRIFQAGLFILASMMAVVENGFAQETAEVASKTESLGAQGEKLCLPQYLSRFETLRSWNVQQFATEQKAQAGVQTLFQGMPSVCEADAYEEFMEFFTNYAKDAFDGSKQQLWVTLALASQRPSGIKKDPYVNATFLTSTTKQALDSIQGDRCQPTRSRSKKSPVNCPLITRIMASVTVMVAPQEFGSMYPELEKTNNELQVPSSSFPPWAMAALEKMNTVLSSNPERAVLRSELSKIKFWMNGIWGWVLNPTKDPAIPANWEIADTLIASTQVPGVQEMENLVRELQHIKVALPLRTPDSRIQAGAALQAIRKLMTKEK